MEGTDSPLIDDPNIQSRICQSICAHEPSRASANNENVDFRARHCEITIAYLATGGNLEECLDTVHSPLQERILKDGTALLAAE
jgi:hypothetical protein